MIVRSRARRRPGSLGHRGFCPSFNLERVLTYITPPVLSCPDGADECVRDGQSKVIDLHCHLLPGVDDGPRSLGQALALAAASVENGISSAVVTPHVYPGHFENSLSSLLPVFANFRAALDQAGIKLELHLGAEVRLHPDAFELFESGDLPVLETVAGGRTVLLEFPDAQVPVGALAACKHFILKGVRPLIAHPERNKEFMREPSRVKPFLDAGCLLQITAASVVGGFGPQAWQAAHAMLANGWVAVMATDCHNLAHRPPVLRQARDVITQRYGLGLAHRLTHDTPAEILGQGVPKLEADA